MRFVLCGSAGTINPYEVTRPVIRQKILLLLNRVNLKAEEVAGKLGLSLEEVLENIAVLKEAGLVREVNKVLAPSFPIFTNEDYDALKPLLEELSMRVKEVVERWMSEVRSLIKEFKFTRRGLNFPDLYYIVVGAFTLDYEGLEVLRDEGLLVISKEMPGGGRYIFTGFEWPIKIEEAWMWGHNCVTPKGYWFSTHGRLPPRGPRMAFPDMAYVWMDQVGREEAIKRLEVIGELLEHLSSVDLSTNELAKRTGRDRNELMLELSLLWALDYVTFTDEYRWRINRPFFTSEELGKIKAVSRSILGDVVKYFRSKLVVLKERYAQTSPFRNGVPFEESFNFLYHTIFEKALNILIEEKVISEPPLRLDGGRYSPFVARLEDTTSW